MLPARPGLSITIKDTAIAAVIAVLIHEPVANRRRAELQPVEASVAMIIYFLILFRSRAVDMIYTRYAYLGRS